MSEPGYESSGYERSMGTKRLDTAVGTSHTMIKMRWVCIMFSPLEHEQIVQSYP